MFERLMKYLDWVAIPTGLAALICNILLSNEGVEKNISCVLCTLAAILGGIYIAYAVILWCRKPQFDWHLINGHFLRKVCCLVLLIPSILAFFSRPYILVQTSHDVEEFRRELFSTLNEEKQKNIIIYYGSRTSKKDIEDCT